MPGMDGSEYMDYEDMSGWTVTKLEAMQEMLDLLENSITEIKGELQCLHAKTNLIAEKLDISEKKKTEKV